MKLNPQKERLVLLSWNMPDYVAWKPRIFIHWNPFLSFTLNIFHNRKNKYPSLQTDPRGRIIRAHKIIRAHIIFSYKHSYMYVQQGLFHVFGFAEKRSSDHEFRQNIVKEAVDPLEK